MSEVVLDDVLEIGPGDQVVVDGDVRRERVARSRRVAAHRRVRDGAEAAGLTDHVGQLRVGRHRPLSGDEGRTGCVRGRAGRGSPALHARALRAARRHRHDHQVRDLRRWCRPRSCCWSASCRRPTACRTRCARRSAASSRWCPKASCLLTSVAFAVGVVRLGQVQHARAGAPRGGGARARRRALPRQDGHAHRRRDRRAVGRDDRRRRRVASQDALAALAAADPSPNATALALREAFPSPPGWQATGAIPFASVRKWSAVAVRRARLVVPRRARRAAPHRARGAMPTSMRASARGSRSRRRSGGASCCWRARPSR